MLRYRCHILLFLQSTGLWIYTPLGCTEDTAITQPCRSPRHNNKRRTNLSTFFPYIVYFPQLLKCTVGGTNGAGVRSRFVDLLL